MCYLTQLMFYVNNFELLYFYNYGYVSRINTCSDTQLILALQSKLHTANIEMFGNHSEV